MTTSTTTAPARATVRPGAHVPGPGAYDRIFYSSVAIGMAVAVLIGFGPTFYLRGVFGARPTVSGATELTLLAQLHGVVFTAWVVLFIVQTTLVARRQVATHRRMGVAGAALAAVMVVVGFLTATAAARRGASPPGADSLSFLVVPLFDLVLFAGFVAAAVVMRRNKETHKRLMLMAYVSIIAAAFARFPGLLQYGPFAFFGLAFLVVLIGVAYDLMSRGRIHHVYLWGGGLFALSVPARLALSQTPAWRAFAEFLTR